jgi:hypothetical chaperone protein
MELVAVEAGQPTMPTAVFYQVEGRAAHEPPLRLYGRAALAAYIEGHEGRLMRSMKSVLGSTLAEQQTDVGAGHAVRYLDVVGGYLQHLKTLAERAAGAPLTRVVLGRPVYFVDDDPLRDAQAQEALAAAARSVGFSEVSFQYEPIAAALDYEQQVTREELALVIDLGGGTSDFSVVRVAPGRQRAGVDRDRDILATAGVHIGGTDFDRLLSLKRAMPELGYQTPTLDRKRPLPSGPYVDLATWHRINRLYTAEQLRELMQTESEALYPARAAVMTSIVRHREGHALAGAVEAAKIALTRDEAVTLDFAGEDVTLALPVTRKELAAALAVPIARIGDTIGLTLNMAGLKAGRIETLILTGGSTQIPAILASLRSLFPQARFVETDAFGSVGLGLALEARRVFGT